MRDSRLPTHSLRRLAAACLLFLALGAATQAASVPSSVTFVGVALDPETSRADERLREYFRGRLGFKFENRDMEYGAAIDTLVHWDVDSKGPLMGRVTPYVYVAAEM